MLTTFDDTGPVVEARTLYIPQRKGYLDDEEYRNRAAVYAWVNNDASHDYSEEEILSILIKLNVKTIVVERNSSAHNVLRILGEKFGYSFIEEFENAIVYEYSQS